MFCFELDSEVLEEYIRSGLHEKSIHVLARQLKMTISGREGKSSSYFAETVPADNYHFDNGQLLCM